MSQKLKGYRYKKAHGMARHRVAVKAARRRKFTDKMWRYAKKRLWEGLTFEQFSGRAKRDGIPMVCKEPLYREYYARQELVRKGESREVPPPLLRRPGTAPPVLMGRIAVAQAKDRVCG